MRNVGLQNKGTAEIGRENSGSRRAKSVPGNTTKPGALTFEKDQGHAP